MPQTRHEQQSRAQHWHQSGLDVVLGCARRWYLENIAQVPTPAKASAAAGTAYHKAVELHERARMEGGSATEEWMLDEAHCAIDDLAASFDPYQLAGLQLEVTGKRGEASRQLAGLDVLKHQASCAVANFWHAPMEATGQTPREYLLGMQPVAVELYLRGTLAPGLDDLAGTVDGLYRRQDGSYLLVDHKTVNDLGRLKKPDHYQDQAIHYGALMVLDQGLSQVAADLPLKMIPSMVFLGVLRERGKTARKRCAALLEVAPTALHAGELAKRVSAAQRVKNQQVYHPNPEYTWCDKGEWSCPYRDRCVMGDRTLSGSVVLGLPVRRVA